MWLFQIRGFPGGLDSKEFACNVADMGLMAPLSLRVAES